MSLYVEELGELVEVQEGKTRVLVPNLEKYKVEKKIEPAHAPVFYNPAMEVNRSISVLAIETYRRMFDLKTMTICEPLAGTGVRGLRYVNEINSVSKVILNDIDDRAYKLIRLNVEHLSVSDKVDVYKEDASALLLTIRSKYIIDVVDIDPFGSPIPFIHAALRAVRHLGLLCVTATDVGVLVGRYPHKCIRRYGAKPIRAVPFSKEIGLRILIGTIARIALEFDYGVKPLLAYYEGHYYRAFLLVGKDTADARECVENLGFLIYNPEDGSRTFVRTYPVAPGSGAYGPMWIGKLIDPEFARELSRVLEEYDYLKSNRKVSELVQLFREEAYLSNVVYMTSSEVCRGLGSEISASTIVSLLRELGHDACRTHFDKRAFRTTLSLSEVRKIVSLYRS